MKPAKTWIIICFAVLRGLNYLALAYLCAVVTNFFGILGGLAVLGVTLLWSHIDHLPSPDGTRGLVSYRRSNARVCYLAAIVVLIGIVRRDEIIRGLPVAEQCTNLFYGVLGVSILLFFFIPLFFSIFPNLHHYSKMIVMENGRIIVSHTRCCSLDTVANNFLWLPDGKALLVADADEHDWHFYLWHLDGLKPVFRPITFKEDWPWLEPLWREYGVIAEAYLKVPPLREGEPRDYVEHLRWFFRHLIPQCRAFPNQRYRLHKGNYKERIKQYFLNIGNGILNDIPEESTAYRRLRRLTERRMELIQSRHRRLAR